MNDSLRTLKLRWDDYRRRDGFDQFADFASLLNAIAGKVDTLKARGRARQFDGLEPRHRPGAHSRRR